MVKTLHWGGVGGGRGGTEPGGEDKADQLLCTQGMPHLEVQGASRVLR